MNDPVNHPSHYTAGNVECINAIAAALIGLSGEEAYDTGAAIKYLWRWKKKNGVEDLRKAVWYINRLIEKAEPEKVDRYVEHVLEFSESELSEAEKIDDARRLEHLADMERMKQQSIQEWTEFKKEFAEWKLQRERFRAIEEQTQAFEGEFERQLERDRLERVNSVDLGSDC